MRSRRRDQLITWGGVVAIIAVVAFLTRPEPDTTERPDFDELLALLDSDEQLAETASPDPILMAQAGAEGEIRGAPLGAAPPEDGTAGFERPSSIPEASWDLIDQFDNAAEGFERTKDGKHLKVTFKALADFVYRIPEPKAVREGKYTAEQGLEQIPEKLRKLDGQPTVLVGFMVPYEVDRSGRVTAFALTQNQSFCCFGIPPAINELVMVEMEEGKAAQYANDLPVAVYGTMEVGEEFDDGYIVSIYRMTGTEVTDVRRLLSQSQG